VDLEATVRDLAARVLGYCILRTGDPLLAEEIAQESLTALVQCWRRHGPPRSPDAFVFAVARRRAARAVLKRRLLLPLDHLLSRHDGRPGPEASLARNEERRRLVAALTCLRRTDRDLILLLTVADVTVKDAAALFGISISAVKMRALRAKRHLRALLENGDVPFG
jgi:RNA polymerase sigma-70 factor (ECF subfamily)